VTSRWGQTAILGDLIDGFRNEGAQDMEYKSFERDFVHRTLANLRLIETSLSDRNSEGADEVKAFEVTQLINSLLGLVVMPHGLMGRRIDETPLEVLEAGGWKFGVKNWPSNYLRTLGRYVRHLRNSIAHMRIRIEAPKGVITGISLSDRSGFLVMLDVDDLRILAERLALYLLERDQSTDPVN